MKKIKELNSKTASENNQLTLRKGNLFKITTEEPLC